MDKPIKENQAVNPSQSTASGPVGTDESITPPDQSTQSDQSAADTNPLVESKGEKSGKSEKPAKKKKPWSAPVLQFLDEEEETDGQFTLRGNTVHSKADKKEYAIPGEGFTQSGDDYSPS